MVHQPNDDTVTVSQVALLLSGGKYKDCALEVTQMKMMMTGNKNFLISRYFS